MAILSYLLSKNASVLSTTDCDLRSPTFLHVAAKEPDLLREVLRVRPDVAPLLLERVEGSSLDSPFRIAMEASGDTSAIQFEIMIAGGLPLGPYPGPQNASALAELFCYIRGIGGIRSRLRSATESFIGAGGVDASAVACGIDLPGYGPRLLQAFTGRIAERCPCIRQEDDSTIIRAIATGDADLISSLFSRMDITRRYPIDQSQKTGDLLYFVGISKMNAADKRRLMVQLLDAGLPAASSNFFDALLEFLGRTDSSVINPETFELLIRRGVPVTINESNFERARSATDFRPLMSVLEILLREGVSVDPFARFLGAFAASENIGIMASYMGGRCSGPLGAHLLAEVVGGRQPDDDVELSVRALLACGANPRELSLNCQTSIGASERRPSHIQNLLQSHPSNNRSTILDEMVQTRRIPSAEANFLCMGSLLPSNWPKCSDYFATAPRDSDETLLIHLARIPIDILKIISKVCGRDSIASAAIRRGRPDTLQGIADLVRSNSSYSFVLDGAVRAWVDSLPSRSLSDTILVPLLAAFAVFDANRLEEEVRELFRYNYPPRLHLVPQSGVLDPLAPPTKAHLFLNALAIRDFELADELYERYTRNHKHLLKFTNGWSGDLFDPSYSLKSISWICNATWVSRVLYDAHEMGWKWNFTAESTPLGHNNLFGSTCASTLSLFLSDPYASEFPLEATSIDFAYRDSHPGYNPLLPLLQDRRVKPSMLKPLEYMLQERLERLGSAAIATCRAAVDAGLNPALLTRLPSEALWAFFDGTIDVNSTSEADKAWFIDTMGHLIEQNSPDCCVEFPCRPFERYTGPRCTNPSVLSMWINRAHARGSATPPGLDAVLTTLGSGINRRVFPDGKTLLHRTMEMSRDFLTNV
eukprot:TRINITY_DN1563_c0_g2_i1.p1 TRINITY_DN1563_c0_g2~~TRINITY_DN1563_c0_g2_i1.p1  ORF type:complete len:990 (+),score=32.91 TRINITY_DN1563_c0_g2_i1:343-2970(+)